MRSPRGQASDAEGNDDDFDSEHITSNHPAVKDLILAATSDLN
jgi:hypothetical protein